MDFSCIFWGVFWLICWIITEFDQLQCDIFVLSLQFGWWRLEDNSPNLMHLLGLALNFKPFYFEFMLFLE